MMLRPLITSVLTVSLAALASAQQTSAAGQQKTRQQLEAIIASHFEAFNNKDAQTIAALYAPNGIVITSAWGMIVGKQAIEEKFRSDFKTGANARETVKVDQVQTIDRNTALAAGPFTVMVGGKEVHGNFLLVFGHEGDAWKLRAASFSRQVTPGAVGSATPNNK